MTSGAPDQLAVSADGVLAVPRDVAVHVVVAGIEAGVARFEVAVNDEVAAAEIGCGDSIGGGLSGQGNGTAGVWVGETGSGRPMIRVCPLCPKLDWMPGHDCRVIAYGQGGRTLG